MDKAKQASLVKEFKEGNKEAFGLLYESFIRPIYNFIYYKTHHKETAEDLTSRVFIKAYGAIGTYDEAKGSFSSWLYQIARNSVIDHYRSVKPTLNVDDAWDLDGGDDVEKDVGIKIQLESIKTYLQALPSEQRDIVIMRVWEEMSYVEISEVVGKTEANCKMIFSRTLKKLREMMPEEMLAVMFLISLVMNSK